MTGITTSSISSSRSLALAWLPPHKRGMTGDWSRFLSSAPRPALPILSKTDDEDDKETQRCVWRGRMGEGLFPWSPACGSHLLPNPSPSH